MSNKPTSRELARAPRLYVREGEGVALDVRVTHEVGVSGQSIGFMEVDPRNAPVPDRRYVADMYAIAVEGRSVYLMFGQARRGGGGELRSLLVIQMSRFAVSQFVSAVDQVKNPTFAQIVAATGAAPQPPRQVDREPDQTVEVSANFVLSGMSGEEATIDFYKASPFAMHVAPQLGKLSLDPVVRVDMLSEVAVGAIEELRKIAERFPQRKPGVGP